MAALSRRRVLGLCAVSLGGVSGCAGAPGRGTPTETVAASERTFEHCTENPPTRQLRHPDGESAIRSSAFSPVEDWQSVHWLVTSPDERDALDYASSARRVAETREFVDATDLSERTVLVHQHAFEDCPTLRLERLKWTESESQRVGAFELGLEYEDAKRTENCEDDATNHTIATVTRLPADVAAVDRFTWGTAAIGGNDC